MADLATPWFTAYAVQVLEWDSPILEAIGAYWHYVVKECARIHRSPRAAQKKAVADPATDPGVRHQLVQHNGLFLKYVPEAERTSTMCREAVEQVSEAIQYVPVQTDELCRIALKRNGHNIARIREPTAEQCLLAVTESSAAINDIPAQFRTYELLRAMIQHDGRGIGYVWEEDYEEHPDLFMLAVQQNGLAIQDISDNLLTEELFVAAVAQNPRALQFVPDVLINTPQIHLAGITGHLSRLSVEDAEIQREVADLAQRVAALSARTWSN